MTCLALLGVQSSEWFLKHTFHLLGVRVLSPLSRKTEGENLGEAVRRRLRVA